MTYGCIGEHLKHSFSKEIHALIADYDYEIREIPKNELDSFMIKRDFLGINVTIPYKETVIPHLYFTDEGAKLIGAVNTIVNRAGKLYGYNTDFYGMSRLIEHAGVSLDGKKVLILGSGGTSKTAFAVASALGAKEIIKASRRGGDGTVLYEDVYREHTDAQIIINTTPVGMFPNIFSSPVDIEKFPHLSGVIDAIYNPERTPLILAARKRGIAAEGGLYMLVAQAVRASEIFTDTEYPRDLCDKVYKKISKDKENTVLIGMPASGKSTVGRLLSEKLSRELIDTDTLISERADMSIPEIFKTFGEERFRELETQVIREVSARTGVIIATGGGAVLRRENVDALRENGRIFFLDRSPELLVATSDRPLSSTKEAIAQRYRERYPIYTASCDERIDADGDELTVADKIIKARH